MTEPIERAEYPCVLGMEHPSGETTDAIHYAHAECLRQAGFIRLDAEMLAAALHDCEAGDCADAGRKDADAIIAAIREQQP